MTGAPPSVAAEASPAAGVVGESVEPLPPQAARVRAVAAVMAAIVKRVVRERDMECPFG